MLALTAWEKLAKDLQAGGKVLIATKAQHRNCYMTCKGQVMGLGSYLVVQRRWLCLPAKFGFLHYGRVHGPGHPLICKYQLDMLALIARARLAIDLQTIVPKTPEVRCQGSPRLCR